MKIELTEDEVRMVGEERYRLPKWDAIAPLVLLLTAFLAAFIPNHIAQYVGVFIFATLAVVIFIKANRKRIAAGRRFLEEQKKLWEKELIEKGQLRLVDENGIHTSQNESTED